MSHKLQRILKEKHNDKAYKNKIKKESDFIYKKKDTNKIRYTTERLSLK